MITHNYDEVNNLLDLVFIGKNGLSEVYKAIDFIMDLPLMQKNLYVRIIIQKDSFGFGVKELASILKYNRRITLKYEKVIAALVVNDPVQTAISYLFRDGLEGLNYYCRVFSSFKAATRWLYIDIKRKC
ncbi:hypothetical protein [Saccharicrinis aurantiacus]|uniref:hypothetical protein n=1 Tax=Saccharicrinis aurantiacus TaxID=1849719 RepID=UPI00248F6D7C|nr:hypothetical protein [Saccharicrinis aurantiacus]